MEKESIMTIPIPQTLISDQLSGNQIKRDFSLLNPHTSYLMIRILFLQKMHVSSKSTPPLPQINFLGISSSR